MYVKGLLFLSSFTKISVRRNVLGEKFHEKLPDGSRVILCGKADGMTYMTRLVVVASNFEKAPHPPQKKSSVLLIIQYSTTIECTASLT